MRVTYQRLDLLLYKIILKFVIMVLTHVSVKIYFYFVYVSFKIQDPSIYNVKQEQIEG